MFNETKYTRIYMSIVKKAKSLSRKKNKKIYLENHHIIPKSFGGTNHPDNLVLLTAKEHFVVHHLLTKMIDEKDKRIKMIHAFWRMCNTDHQKQKITSRIYNSIREERNKHLSETKGGKDNHFYGKKHTEETKALMREKAKIRNPENYFGRIYSNVWNKGLTKENSEGVKKISESKKGNKNPMSKRTGKLHPNTESYILLDSKNDRVGPVFNSRKEFGEYCLNNGLPFHGLYKTKDGTFYNAKMKNHKYDNFWGWSLRRFESQVII